MMIKGIVSQDEYILEGPENKITSFCMSAVGGSAGFYKVTY